MTIECPFCSGWGHLPHYTGLGRTPCDDCGGVGKIELPELTDEERKAMDDLPDDFIDRILRGERPIKRVK